ncbi:hypothetical protein Acsp05_41930 [Actinokineospora sp. NBRC 105648]|nr:hypothetical protein Acsp05_41930 [Actinokineospora sp. NBRC 105648]
MASRIAGAGSDLPDATGTPHRHDVTRLDATQVRAHPPGRAGVGGEDRGEVVLDRLRHDERAVVGERHADDSA